MSGEIFSDLVEAVRQQLASDHTPYVGETFKRLLERGISEDDAVEQIAICLGDELEDMALRRREFDEDAFREALESLPFPE